MYVVRTDVLVLVPIRVLAQCLVKGVTSAPDTRSMLWAAHVTAEGTQPWADAILYVPRLIQTPPIESR